MKINQFGDMTQEEFKNNGVGCGFYNFKLGRKAVEETRNIYDTFGQGTTNQHMGQWWFKKFRSGDESLEDEERSGRPQDNYDELKALVEASPRTIVPELAEELDVDTLKYALVTPVLKTGNNSLVDNYRQISVLNSLLKIFENILYQDILSYLMHRFSLQQHGFLPDVSTVTNLSILTEAAAGAIDNKEQLDVVLTDCAKAFYRVDHGLLVNKLVFKYMSWMDMRQIRTIFLFQFKLGRKAAEETRDINDAFGQGTTNGCTAQRWFKKFRSGDESLEDEERSGRPHDVNYDELKALVVASARAQLFVSLRRSLMLIQKNENDKMAFKKSILNFHTVQH
ncbi:unnamed protein product [Acanthoscelides obtectus]|uniref:Mos1 transposase HTH domain-containing protein n=1 Tax=Acanthoscelides obtectus TaxID=200917 RepID=A0A9P0JXU0_ACAOB|nr:unnamed protein product [Acanthoscelides obtectus]CAK1631488.1 Histone-lysine N-methyltransferase SETMAR [Acanthoscelides obtectus]